MQPLPDRPNAARMRLRDRCLATADHHVFGKCFALTTHQRYRLLNAKRYLASGQRTTTRDRKLVAWLMLTRSDFRRAPLARTMADGENQPLTIHERRRQVCSRDKGATTIRVVRYRLFISSFISRIQPRPAATGTLAPDCAKFPTPHCSLLIGTHDADRDHR